MSDTAPSPVQKTLEMAYQDAFVARKELLKRRVHGQVTQDFLLEYQSDLANYWLTLRMYRDRDAVEPVWASATLRIDREDVQPVVEGEVGDVLEIQGGGHAEGLDELGEWINAEAVVERVKPGTQGRYTEMRRVPVALPTDTLLAAHTQLDDVAREVGLVPDAREVSAPAAEIEVVDGE